MTPGDAQGRGDAPTPPPTPAERPESPRSQTLGTFGANIAAAVLSLANVLVVARTLGAAGRGEVAFLIAVSTLVTWVASIGIQQANANIGANRSATVPRLATNSVLWALGLGVASTLVVTALVAIFPAAGGPVPPLLLTLTLVFVPCTLLKLFLQYLLQSHYHFKITNIAWVAGPTISVVINTTLAALGLLTVEASIAIWLAGQTFSAVLLSWYLARHFGFDRPDRALARESASFGLKTHIGELAALGNYRADQWFVGAIAGSRELGRYSIAVAWAELLFYIPGVIALLQRPDLVRADPSAAIRLAGQSIRRGLLLSLVGASVLIIAAPLLCVTVFGDDFHGSIDDLRVLALGGVGIATVVLLGNTMIAQRRPLLAAAADATALVVTLGLDILLIPSLGGLGAAIATTVAYGVGSLVLTIVFVRLLGGRARDLVPRLADVAWYSRQAGSLLALVPRRGVAP